MAVATLINPTEVSENETATGLIESNRNKTICYNKGGKGVDSVDVTWDLMQKFTKRNWGLIVKIFRTYKMDPQENIFLIEEAFMRAASNYDFNRTQDTEYRMYSHFANYLKATLTKESKYQKNKISWDDVVTREGFVLKTERERLADKEETEETVIKTETEEINKGVGEERLEELGSEKVGLVDAAEEEEADKVPQEFVVAPGNILRDKAELLLTTIIDKEGSDAASKIVEQLQKNDIKKACNISPLLKDEITSLYHIIRGYSNETYA